MGNSDIMGSNKTTKRIAPKDRPLTVKQAAFVQELIDNPKQSKARAAFKAYSRPDKTITRRSAEQIAYENMRKPEIISRLADYNEIAESAIVTTISDWKDHEKPRQREIAMDMAKYVHDKIHGKATQQVEMRSQQVTVSIDLTASDDDSTAD